MPIEDSLFCQNPVLGLTGRKDRKKEINKGKRKSDCRSQIWTLYFDGSKSQEGSGAGCILIDPKG
jgi:hypothetical protein